MKTKTRTILKSRIPDILKNLPTHMDEALSKAGHLVEGEAKIRTPVKFGRLKASITTKTHRQTTSALADSVRRGTVIVGTNVEYAPYVHENPDAFHKVGEYKFLEKAVLENRDRLVSIMRASVTTALGKAGD